MKRLLCIFSAVLLLTACRNVHTEKPCETLIIVDQTKIPEREYDNWMEKNSAYIANVPDTKAIVGNCAEKRIYIEASSIEQVKYPEWLKANGHYICFNGTYPYIECAHSIDTTDIVISKKLRDKLTLAEIKEEITRKGGNFEDESYDKYTSLSFDTNKNLVISMVDRFTVNNICYSIPLFRSVVAKYNLNNSSVFEFMQADMKTYRTIIFKVQDRNGINNYYDFSQIPP